jgi:hypothetical protein
MTENAIQDQGSTHSRRLRIIFLLVIVVALIISPSFIFNVSAQDGDTGLGVGRGHGTEVGINLPVLNSLKADVARGLYDRPCTAAEHDPTKWHTLVNIQAKCHYDHMHGDDPNYVNDLFGEPGAWFGKPRQSISYPWQTYKAKTSLEPNDAYVAAHQMENDLKHEGYVWIVRRDQSCPTDNCITDFRLQTHAIFGAHDMAVRYHSYSFEARLCRYANNPSSCGTIRFAGWADTGRLFTTAPGVMKCNHDVAAIFISLPADTLYFPIDAPEARDEIRCHPNVTSLPAYPSAKPLAEWWAHGGGESRFHIFSYDPIGNVDPANPERWQFFCGQNDMNCRYDASILSAFIGYTIHMHSFFQPGNIPIDKDKNGRTDYKGYFNRWGTVAPSCRAVSVDCIPYEYDNVILNFRNNEEGRYFHTQCETCTRVDMDISPPGQKWITWFYRFANGGHPTPIPPTPTPRPGNTPIPPTATPRPGNTPLPPTPTSRPPATPVPTLSPLPSGQRTLTLQINNGSNDVNEVNGVLAASSAPMWIGNGGSTSSSFAGLRFTNVTIPRGATIQSAYLQVYSTQSQWMNIGVQIAAEAADNSGAFSSSSRPSQRRLTSVVNYNANVQWAANTWYSLSDMTNVIRQITTRSGWTSGNSLSIILKGTSPGSWGRHFVQSLEGNGAYAVRLVIRYISP